MNLKDLYKHLIVLLITSHFLISCVGTVKSVDEIKTKVSSSTTNAIVNFAGIHSAIPISESKVELFFAPIEANLDDYSYVITFDNQQIPIYIPANSLVNDYRGFAKYTVTNLIPNKKYTFQVQAKNIKTLVESSNSAKVAVTTFSNFTANFYGISEVRNLSGSAGLKGIEVIWPEAETKGSDIFPNEIDPILYEITFIDSSVLNPGEMNNKTYSEPFRKVVSVAKNKRNLVVNGLNSNTKYYVQVRAIHSGYSLNSGSPNYKVEQNTNYLEITTYSEDLANLNFNNNSFYLALPPGSGGLYALQSHWTIPTGNFDHFRVYYVKAGLDDITAYLNTDDLDILCMGAETSKPNINCDYAPYTSNSLLLTNLEPYTNYNTVLVVCLTASCERSKRITSFVATKKTNPSILAFNGITTIESSSDINELNTLKLNFTSPDFTTGNISGYLVDYYGNNPENPTPVILNDPNTLNTTTLTVDDFDYLTANSITIRGIDYQVTDQQCFLIYPFAYDSNGNKIVSKAGLIPMCATPMLKGPLLTQFSGFTSSADDCNMVLRQVNLSWDLPTGGVYDQFEIFYLKSDVDNFSFSSAIDYENNPAYKRILRGSTTTSYTMTNMATGPGAVYKFGILTYYNSPTIPVRSDFNLKIITCDFR